MRERRATEVAIGVDVGTTSTKASAYDVRARLLASANIATTIRRRDDAVDQDPDELLRAVHASIRECVAAMEAPASAVRAIALTGQMAGVMGIDSQWEPVTAYDSWLDARCADQLRTLSLDHAELLVRRTGCPPMLDHAPKMQWWRDRRPAEYEQIAAFVMPAVYVAGRLAGLTADAAWIDPTYLHFTGVADAASGAWCSELLSALGLERAKLPRIVASDTVVGDLTSEAAARCGLEPGTTIIAGMGDTAAGALGAGLLEVGELLDTAGTAAVLAGLVADFRPDEAQGLILMRAAMAERWMPLNYVAGAGLCLPWLAEQLTTDVSGTGLSELLAEAESAPPGSAGLAFVPHLEGRIAPPAPALRGGWHGLGLEHGRAHLVRSVLEAVAMEYAVYLRSMRMLYPDVRFGAVRAIGGGARSRVWNQIKADVLGVPVTRVPLTETATRGAALLAAAGAGLANLRTTAAEVPAGETVEPDPVNHERYGELIEQHAELVDLFAQRSNIVSTTREAPLVS